MERHVNGFIMCDVCCILCVEFLSRSINMPLAVLVHCSDISSILNDSSIVLSKISHSLLITYLLIDPRNSRYAVYLVQMTIGHSLIVYLTHYLIRTLEQGVAVSGQREVHGTKGGSRAVSMYDMSLFNIN